MTAELFSPPSKALDADANPLSGAKWYFYQTETLTPQNVYADADLGTSLGPVVTADSAGKFVPIYFDASLLYRGVCKDSSGAVTLHDIDPVNATILTDLASTAAGMGASKIGNENGGDVQDYIDADSMDLAITWEPGATSAKAVRDYVTAIDHTTLPEIIVNFTGSQTVEPVGALGTVYKIGVGGKLTSTALHPELYGMNPVVEGKAGGTNGFLVGIEGDVNNTGDHADDISTGYGAYGFLSAFGGTKRGTAGFRSAGYFDPSKPNYGFAATGFHRLASFYDSSDATDCMKIKGAHQSAIDTTEVASLVQVIAAANNQTVIAQKDSGGTLRALVKLNASDRMELGGTGVSYIQCNQSLLPSAANTYALGSGAADWSDLFVHNSPIVVSDPAFKRDLRDLPLDLSYDLVTGLAPKIYRMAEGGATVEMEEQDGDVEESFLVETGTDAKGHPILEFETRTVPGKVMVPIRTPREGIRQHMGFNADQARDLIEQIGLDLAIYVLADGKKRLRQEQLIAPIINVLADVVKRLEALEQA